MSPGAASPIGTLPPAPHYLVLGPRGSGIWNRNSNPGITHMSLLRALSHLILYKVLAGDHTHSRDFSLFQFEPWFCPIIVNSYVTLK